MLRPRPRAPVVVVLSLAAACVPAPEARRATPDAGATPFEDATAASGINFVHETGARGGYLYPELIQGGLALLDIDNDGWLDVYLVQAGPLPADRGSAAGNDRLLRNRRDGTFEDISAAAGIDDRAYGSGAIAADYDRDGHIDLYVTNLGPNLLYRNRGDGTFEDATERAGVGDSGWSIGASFVDYDRDGDLDLFVANYVVWSPELEKPCYGYAGGRGYCSPLEYQPSGPRLYRQEADHRFTDATAAAGLAAFRGNGMGVVAADLTGDGWPDLYVANDQMPNFLFVNQRDGTFIEEAALRGTAVDGSGAPEASMGIALGDPDEDGDLDLLLTHLAGETNTYYRNLGSGDFTDWSEEVGLGTPSLPFTGFGTAFLDYDHDGALDLFVANGKVRVGDEMSEDYAERNQLFHAAGPGSWREVPKASGALGLVETSRGAAVGDLDNDGDLDLLIINSGGPARWLRNRGGAGAWLLLDLVGTRSGRVPIGAVATVSAQGRVWRRVVQPAGGYATSHDPRLHFGLGAAAGIESLLVVWPDGQRTERSGVAVNQILELQEP